MKHETFKITCFNKLNIKPESLKDPSRRVDLVEGHNPI